MTEEDQKLRRFCLSVYEETRNFPAIVECRNLGLGFEILLGAPRKRPPMLFIGYQPGCGEKLPGECIPGDDNVVGCGKMSVERARRDGYENSWVVEECHYASPLFNFSLANKMKAMFRDELLKVCVGLNAIFVGARNIEHYKALSPALRTTIQSYCLKQVERMVDEIEPQKIVIIGFETLRLFGDGPVLVKNEKGKPLVRTSKVFGRSAIATVHLSGFAKYLSPGDPDKIRDAVLNFQI